MIVLTVRTDKPEAEIGLYRGGERVAYETWQAHRQLSETIHQKLDELLQANNLALENVEGIVFYEGPGSFTGLRIGASVVNALGYSFSVPVASAGGESWIKQGVQLILDDSNTGAVPQYGEPARTTARRLYAGSRRLRPPRARRSRALRPRRR